MTKVPLDRPRPVEAPLRNGLRAPEGWCPSSGCRSATGTDGEVIRRGTYTSAKELIIAIEIFIDDWNDRCQPFTWTKTADQILTKATCGQRSSFTRH